LYWYNVVIYPDVRITVCGRKTHVPTFNFRCVRSGMKHIGESWVS